MDDLVETWGAGAVGVRAHARPGRGDDGRAPLLPKDPEQRPPEPRNTGQPWRHRFLPIPEMLMPGARSASVASTPQDLRELQGTGASIRYLPNYLGWLRFVMRREFEPGPSAAPASIPVCRPSLGKPKCRDRRRRPPRLSGLLKKSNARLSDSSRHHRHRGAPSGSAGRAPSRRSRTRSSLLVSDAAARGSSRTRRRIGRQQSAFPRSCNSRSAGS